MEQKKGEIKGGGGSIKLTFTSFICVFFIHLFLGYYGNGVNAIIVFAACFLPDSDREDYHDIMENLFL